MTRDDYLKAVGSFEPDEDMKRRVLSGMAAQPRRCLLYTSRCV